MIDTLQMLATLKLASEHVGSIAMSILVARLSQYNLGRRASTNVEKVSQPLYVFHGVSIEHPLSADESVWSLQEISCTIQQVPHTLTL